MESPDPLSPTDTPLLDDVVFPPPSGPLAAPGALATRLASYRSRGLTPAEALTWLLAHDLGRPLRETARLRGVTLRTARNTVSRARLKLGYSFDDPAPE